MSVQVASNGTAPVLRAWRAVARSYAQVEATPLGHLLLANVWPAYLFAFLLAARLWGLYVRFQAGAASGIDLANLHDQAMLAQEVATVAFLLLIVVLFVVRKPVVGSRADWRGGLVALGGTI